MALQQESYLAMRIEKRPNGVAVVTLNRPERLNAVNGTLHHELARFTRDAESDPDVRVVVLAGAGRAFCAGGDFGPDSNTGGLSLEEGRQIVDHLLELRKPIVSAVQGYAMGLGATIALLCDVVVAGRSTVFADTHVKMGIGAGDGGQVIWPLLMGVNRAKWFLMTGERVSGELLFEMGLVNFLVEDNEIFDKALACADQLAAGPARGDQRLEGADQPLHPHDLEPRPAALLEPRGPDDAEPGRGGGPARLRREAPADLRHALNGRRGAARTHCGSAPGAEPSGAGLRADARAVGVRVDDRYPSRAIGDLLARSFARSRLRP